MSDLQIENEELKKEVAMLKGVLRNFSEHAIDCEGEEWICSLCGSKAPLAVDFKDFKHETFCPMTP